MLPWSTSVLYLFLSPFFILLVSLQQVLCMLLFKGTVLPEMKCKYLTLELHVKRFNLYGVAGILRASSHVETLNINLYTEALDREGRDIDISTKSVTSSLLLNPFIL